MNFDDRSATFPEGAGLEHPEDTPTRLLTSMKADLDRRDRAAMVTDALRAVELGANVAQAAAEGA
jgi:hypothetical protein